MAAKLFTLLALAACVAGDAGYLGLNRGYGFSLGGIRSYGGYRGYAGFGGYNKGYSAIGYNRGYGRLYKRDAEAEPEADAGYLGLNRGYGYGLAGVRSLGFGGYNGLAGYRGGYNGYANYNRGYATYNRGYGRLYKRDADAEPEADAGVVAPYRGYASYRAAASPYRRYGAYRAGYTAAATYPVARYGSFYGRRNLYKREADAEADAGLARAYFPGRATSYEYRSPQGARGFYGRAFYGARNFYGRRGLYKRSADAGYINRYYGSFGRSFQRVYRPTAAYAVGIYH